jgi:hypothetical protein
VLALVGGATVVLAGLTWTLLHAPADVRPDQASVLVRPRPPAPDTPTVQPPVQDTAPGGDAGTSAGRDPFGGTPPATGTTPVVPPSAPSAPPTAATTTGPATPPGPDTAPTTGAPQPTGAPAPVTVTRTAGPTVTSTVTVTTTAPGSAIYVGLYLWNGDRASFRVNARTWSMHVGATFGPDLTFTAVVPGTPRCARLRHGSDPSFVLCPGQVVRLP